MDGVDIEEIIRRMRTYLPGLDEELLRRADRFIEEAHGGQLRLSNDPYVSHPRNVALILTDLEMDPASVIAGLLHDVLEDTSVTQEQLKEQFGEEIASLVQGVTKLGEIDLATTQE